MKTCSLSAFAKEIGVTPQMIDKHKDRLTLVKVKGKKKKQVDRYGTETLEYLKWRSETHGLEIPFTKSEPEENGTMLAKISTNPSGKTNLTLEQQKNKNWYDIEIKKRTIKEKDLKIEQKRGNLIEKKLVELLFGKIYQIDTDQIKPLGIDLSPKIIAIVNEKNKIKAKSIIDLLEISDNSKLKQIESILNSGEKELKTRIVSTCEDISATILMNVQAEIDNFLNILEVENNDA